MTAEILEARSGVWLPPSALEPHESNLKARPGETEEDRAKRVADLARSIRASGQHYPVLVVARPSEDEFDSEGNPLMRYEYVDGGARVDAIKTIDGAEVWCSVVSAEDDLFRTAVTSNLHRTQNSILQLAQIIQEVRERQGWSGRGGQAKVCEYLGLNQNRVSELEKILRAPKPVRDMISAGEITTVDAALKLMSQDKEVVPVVAARAKEIARQEAALEDEGGAGKAGKKPTSIPILKGKAGKAAAKAAKSVASKPAKPAKVTAKHVAQAAKEIAPHSMKTTPLSRAEIVQSFTELTGLPYPPAAKAWIEYFVDEHVTGKGSEKRFSTLFDSMVGVGQTTGAGAVPVKPITPATPIKPMVKKSAPPVKAKLVKPVKVVAKKAAKKK